MSDDLQSFGEHFVRQVGRTITKADFEKISPFAIAKMSDKELALWQSEHPADSPQFLLAQYEWQRRLTTRQVRATRFAAWIGILGVIIGTLIGWLLSSLRL